MLHFGVFVVGMKSAEMRFYLVMVKQSAARTGVLRQHDSDFLQHPDGAEGDVFEIADGRWDDVEHV